MLRKIKLYGELAKQVGHKEFEDINVSNVAQAVSFLIDNFLSLTYLFLYMVVNIYLTSELNR